MTLSWSKTIVLFIFSCISSPLLGVFAIYYRHANTLFAIFDNLDHIHLPPFPLMLTAARRQMLGERERERERERAVIMSSNFLNTVCVS